MTKSNKLIPELRFPEFSTAGNWQMKELGEYLEYIQPTNYLVNSSLYNDNFKIPVLTAGKTFILGYTDEVEGIFDENLPVIIFDDFTTASKYVDFPFKAKSSAMKILSPKDNTSCKFFFESIQNINYTPGVHQRHWISVFSKLKVPVPETFIEQKKIADCLSSLDELITAHNDKVETLKTYKKGLMQNLFPQEGEKVPKLRFKEFEKDGDWKEKVLEKISNKIMVGIASAATHAYRRSGIILFRNQNIKEGYLDDRDIIFIDEEYEKEHKNKRLKSGDLLTARTGYPGTTCIVPSKHEGSQSFTTLITRPNNTIIGSTFLCFYINSERGQAFFNSTKIGGGQQNVNAGSLSEMPIPFPSRNEQQKIEETLSSVDDLIKEQAEKIEQLKLHKKGLMQGLFPKVKA